MRTRKKRFDVLVAVLLLLSPLCVLDAHSATTVVDRARPGASDENPGTESAPFMTIARAVALAQPGDTVRIHTGVYREAVRIEQSGTSERPIRVEAASGASVVVTGADLLTEWRKEEACNGENVYSTAWPHQFIGWSKTGTHPADDYHKLIGRAEQVIINGYLLQQVLLRDQLGRSTFFADLAAKRLYVQASNNATLDANTERVEGSVRGTLWDVRGDYIHTRGLVFRYGATQAQQALVRLGGRGDLVEDCTFEGANSDGADFRGEDQIARRCTFQDNGQDGFCGGGAHRLLVTECITRNNNTKNFDRGWGAGGCKIVLSQGVVIEKSQFVKNRGNGIWFDIGNENTTIRNCLIADNEDAGIFYEISYGLHAHDNVILGNGLSSGFRAWGANGGIALSSSPDCVIERNLIVGNKEGFQFREQERTTVRIGQEKGAAEVSIWNQNEAIRNNVLALNRDAQVWGWFATADERAWPAGLQQSASVVDNETAGNETVKSVTSPDGSIGPLTGTVVLALDMLHFSFENNLYVVHPSQGLFNWGSEWSRHKKYANLDDVRRELKLDTGGRVGDCGIPNYHSRDFRVPASASAVQMRCYPKGDVPGVRLGVSPESR
ncbi:MAG: right-handed parallel beta-helix repeat-containing protein [Pirellulaceae bacterium]